MRVLSFLILAGYCLLNSCAIDRPLPGCQAGPEVSRVLHSELTRGKLATMTVDRRRAYQDSVIANLIAKYPTEIEPHLERLRIERHRLPGRLPELQSEYRKMARWHPGDPLALVLAANALIGTDTAESIRLAEAARAKAPGFPHALLFLAEADSEGLSANQEKFDQTLRAYFATCASAPSSSALRLLTMLNDPSLSASIARAMRRRLAAVTDITMLNGYSALWSIEFRSTPPAGHEALRRVVAADVKRLEALNPHPEPSYFELLLTGYKQSGAPPYAIREFEDRILEEAPGSESAYSITSRRAPRLTEPESQTDVPGWKAFNRQWIQQAGKWARQFPEVWAPAELELRLQLDDEAFGATEKMAAIEALLAHSFDQSGGRAYLDAAVAYIDRKLNPFRALALLDRAGDAFLEDEKHTLGADNLTRARREDLERATVDTRFRIIQYILKAAALANRPQVAEEYRARIETPLPAGAKPDTQSLYWENRALLATLDRRTADALAYFKQALSTRRQAPAMYHGKTDDPLLDEAKELWKNIGGTEAAWAVWSAPASRAASGGRKQRLWEVPTKDLPSFELTDLSGKSWRLKQLEGKVVMINLWATWCQPCRTELPEIQKLYEKFKDRPDFQVLTFNIDRQPGLVAPYVKEYGYTFPVLLAYDAVIDSVEGSVIPQTWIVDGKGKWRWTQLGYGGEPDWQEEMLKRLESTR